MHQEYTYIGQLCAYNNKFHVLEPTLYPFLRTLDPFRIPSLMAFDIFPQERKWFPVFSSSYDMQHIIYL